jgi:hypothetical protein
MRALNLWSEVPAYLDWDLLGAAGVVRAQALPEADHRIYFTNGMVDAEPGALVAYVEPCIGHWNHAPYVTPERFHTVWMFGTPWAPNQFEITTDPVVFPYGPETYQDIQRDITTLRERRVYYAGMRRGFTQDPDVQGCTKLYATRNAVVEGLRAAGIPTTIEGIGWERESRDDPDWDERKREVMRYGKVDFALCMENSQFRNYVSEKIHHGFQSGLVVLYLGNPCIHEWVPAEAFINLNPLFDATTKVFDHKALADRLRSMTQTEYDDVLHAAWRWRREAKLEERCLAQRKRLTNMLIERIV